MKVIMVMYDSLNRRYLTPYGCDWTITPNFERLTKRTVMFDKSFVGSMPCMPARRELHTARYNFLHRSWGPIEPFDDSMPEILKNQGVYSHLVSDHFHYWEEGGCNYHTKYSTWEISRGRQGDPWIGEVKDPEIPAALEPRNNNNWRQEWVNRRHIKTLEDMPQYKTFEMGLDFIERNKDEDKWFLHIETFDPHEPFFSPKEFQDLYAHEYRDLFWDWPKGGHYTREPHQVEHIRKTYAASVSMCDHLLGKVLDVMDKYDMWKDTMLIVNTDHGYLLGEHDEWAKVEQPMFNEVAHTPLFIWDPRCGKQNEHRGSLVQTIDLPATILELFGIGLTEDMEGRPLKDTIASDKPVHEAGLFGGHGAHVNVTDGRYVYMRAAVREDNEPLYQYTHMATHIRYPFRLEQLRRMEIGGPFKFTKGCPVMKVPSNKIGEPPWPDLRAYSTMLFDIDKDPEQLHPIKSAKLERRMIDMMVQLMKTNDAPLEQYERLGLKKP